MLFFALLFASLAVIGASVGIGIIGRPYTVTRSTATVGIVYQRGDPRRLLCDHRVQRALRKRRTDRP